VDCEYVGANFMIWLGSAACLFRNILHVGHLPTVFNVIVYARPEHRWARKCRWPLWMRNRMSFRKPDGMTLRLLCRIRPSCSYRAAVRARYWRRLPDSLELSFGKPSRRNSRRSCMQRQLPTAVSRFVSNVFLHQSMLVTREANSTGLPSWSKHDPRPVELSSVWIVTCLDGSK